MSIHKTRYIDADIMLSAPADIWWLNEISMEHTYERMYYWLRRMLREPLNEYWLLPLSEEQERILNSPEIIEMVYRYKGTVDGILFSVSVKCGRNCAMSSNMELDETDFLMVDGIRIIDVETDIPGLVFDNYETHLGSDDEITGHTNIRHPDWEHFNVKVYCQILGDTFTVCFSDVREVTVSQSLLDWWEKRKQWIARQV